MANSSIYNALYGGGKIMKNGGSKKILELTKLIYSKKEFLLLVFANLIVQLGITYYVMLKTDGTKINILALFIAQIFIIYILIIVPIPSFLKFILFSFFSYIFGLVLSSLKKKYNEKMIQIALQGTISIFALMFTLGVTLLISGINLGYKFGLFLFWALLVLIILRLVFVLGAGLTAFNKFLSFFGLILFAVYIVFDTNKILQRNYFGDFITASLDYYLDILNLFENTLGSIDN
jgi:FtsH-binding integral membrane protein